MYTTKSYLGFESRSLRKKIPDPEARDFFSTKLILSLCKLCKQRKSLVDRVIPKRGRREVFLVSTGRGFAGFSRPTAFPKCHRTHFCGKIAPVGHCFTYPPAAPQEMYSLRSMVSLNLSQAVLSLYSRPRPVEGIFTVQRPQFCGIFAAVGILKIPSATLSRENHGRRRPFYISTGRAYDINMDFPLMPKMSTLPTLPHYPHYPHYPLPYTPKTPEKRKATT